MIRIEIQDKVGVVVEALVNVKARRVESLVVETERGLNEAFIAEALLAIEMAIEMAARTTRKPEVSLTLDTSKFDAALARYQEVLKRTGDGLKPELRTEPSAEDLKCEGGCE
jgi:hypothetical protein